MLRTKDIHKLVTNINKICGLFILVFFPLLFFRNIKKYNFDEYEKWYLGWDTDEKKDIKGRYKFPYSDFAKAHRCGILAAENRAGQYKYNDIETAAAHLHGMIDASKKDV